MLRGGDRTERCGGRGAVAGRETGPRGANGVDCAAPAERGRFLTLAPRLFGGGSLYGELDPVGFTTVAEALDAPLGPPVAAPDDLDDDTAVEHAHEQLDGRRRALTRGHGRRLADRLVKLCETDLAGARPDIGDTPDSIGLSGRSAAGTDAERHDTPVPASHRTPRPLLLATIDLEALLDRTRTPGWLLHTLAGGRMKITASALQRLVDARGADLRTVVLDDVGQIVGVGRRSHVPPGWLREAIWARDTVVADPDRTCPVRRADLDHVDPWPAGPTDVANLQPLGRTWHNHKTDRRWTVTRTRDGTTTWTHSRHRWQVRLAPPRRDLARPPDPGPPRLPIADLPEPAPT
jgi:hypothetical protein